MKYQTYKQARYYKFQSQALGLHNTKCKTLAYISLVFEILELVMVAFLHYRKSKFCKGHTFSNKVNIMIFIADVQNYIPTKLCKTAGSIYLFKITGILKAENIKLNKNYIWDMLEIDGKKSRWFQWQQN